MKVSNKKLKIGIDLDCVLNNLVEEWVKAYNKKHKQNLQLENIHTWNLIPHMPLELNIYDLLTEELFTNLKPIEGAIEVTKRLSLDDRVELYIITASDYHTVPIKVEWLSKHFPHLKKENTIICFNKSLIEVDVLIDDGLHNVLPFPNKAIVLDYPWNRSVTKEQEQEQEGFTRALDWYALEDILHELVLDAQGCGFPASNAFSDREILQMINKAYYQ